MSALAEVFYWLLNMSAVASFAGVCILLLRRIRRLPRRLTFLLWIIPFLRLLVPLGVGSRYGLMALVSKFIGRAVVVHDEAATITMMNFTMVAKSYFPIRFKSSALDALFSVASRTWLCVAAVLIILSGASYIASKRNIRNAVRLRDNLYLSDAVRSPVVYGVIRPKILLPPCEVREDLAFVIQHENAHIRRRDNLWRIVALATACVHWFNPLVWLFLKCFLADMELSCDEAVLRKSDGEQRKKYAASLVNSAARSKPLFSAFGGASMRQRVQNALSYKKLSIGSSVALAAFITAVVYVLMTNAI